MIIFKTKKKSFQKVFPDKNTQENRKWSMFPKARIVLNVVILGAFLIRLEMSQEKKKKEISQEHPLYLLLLNIVLEKLASKI